MKPSPGLRARLSRKRESNLLVAFTEKCRKEFEFADRSMSSIFIDVNRSLAFGLYGKNNALPRRVYWELAVFNGLVTGGAETGSSGTLDNNHAYSGRIYMHPLGNWGSGELADFTSHQYLATRHGAGFAVTTIDRFGSTEFSSLRAVDSGMQLSDVLPLPIDAFDVAVYSVDASMKFRGLSMTSDGKTFRSNSSQSNMTYPASLLRCRQLTKPPQAKHRSTHSVPKVARPTLFAARYTSACNDTSGIPEAFDCLECTCE